MGDVNELSFDGDNDLIPELNDFYNDSDIAGNYAGFEETVNNEDTPEENLGSYSPEDDQVA